MKNKKVVAIVALILLIGGGVWYFWTSPEQKVSSTETKPLVEHVIKPIQSNKAEKQAYSKPKPPPTEKKLLEMIAANPQMKKLFEFGKAKNTHIYFYGRVIDQHGKPVPHAKVYFSVSRWGYLSTNGYFYDTNTDADGRVAIEGIEGFSLNFRKVEKIGYEYGGGIGSFRGHQRYAGLDPNDPRRSRLWTETSETKPVVFHMWKKVGAEPLIYNDILIGFSPDGKTYAIDLIKPKKTEGGSFGDIKVTFNRPLNAKRNERFNWSVTIEAIGGGLLETTDIFMNEAPESGYHPIWKLEMKKDASNYQSEVTRKFYLKSRNGKVYGRLEFEFIPIYNDNSDIDAKWWLNPNGSRNLQYDPKKRIFPK